MNLPTSDSAIFVTHLSVECHGDKSVAKIRQI